MTGVDRAGVGALASAVRAHEQPSARAASLARLLAQTPRSATRFEDLAGAPDWLGWPPAERLRLGRRAALAAIAPALSASVDGRWLGALARVAGDETLDWARSQAPIASEVAPFAADDLDDIAASALRNGLPPSLRDLAAPAMRDFSIPPAALTAALVR